MGPVVVQCAGRGVRLRIARPGIARTRHCPRSLIPLDPDHALPPAPAMSRDEPIPAMRSEAPPDRSRFAAPGRTPAWIAFALLLLLMVGSVVLRDGTHRGSRPPASTEPARRVRTEPPAPPRAEAPVASPRPREVGPADVAGIPPAEAGRPVRIEAVPSLSPPAPEVPAPPSSDSRRILVRTESGRVVVARVYGQAGAHV